MLTVEQFLKVEKMNRALGINPCGQLSGPCDKTTERPVGQTSGPCDMTDGMQEAEKGRRKKRGEKTANTGRVRKVQAHKKSV
jgi:hypothetical protein